MLPIIILLETSNVDANNLFSNTKDVITFLVSPDFLETGEIKKNR